MRRVLFLLSAIPLFATGCFNVFDLDLPQDSGARDGGGQDSVDSGTMPIGDFVGFGSETRGAEASPEEFEVCRVTDLGDEPGARGTFRDCVSQGNRLVQFDVAGNIVMRREIIDIDGSYITVDGGSAPDPGVTILLGGAEIRISGDIPITQIVFSNIRIQEAESGEYLVGMDGEQGKIDRVVFDHVTFVDSTRGVTVFANTGFITFSNCLFVSGGNALTFQGPFSEGGITIYRNLFRVDERIPQILERRELDYVNNIARTSGERGFVLSRQLDESEPGTGRGPHINVIGSRFRTSGDNPDGAFLIQDGPNTVQAYFEDNSFPPEEMDQNDPLFDGSERLMIPERYQTPIVPLAQLSDTVLESVGTTRPTPPEMDAIAEARSLE